MDGRWLMGGIYTKERKKKKEENEEQKKSML